MAVLTVLVVTAATAFPRQMKKLSGGFEMGVGLAFVFFAAIAAGADVLAMLRMAPLLVVLLVLGKLFRMTLPELVTASNAAVLGATTAPASRPQRAGTIS